MFINILFFLAACLTVGGAIAMLLTKNIMHSCIYLLATLIGIAGLYITLGADFVAAVQLMVYVGGVVILMVFAVMLTGGNSNDAFSKFTVSQVPLMGNKKSLTVGILTAVVFLLSVGSILKEVIGQIKEKSVLPYENTVDKIGISLITEHVLAFEMASVLMLGALVGAAIIARPRSKSVAAEVVKGDHHDHA